MFHSLHNKKSFVDTFNLNKKRKKFVIKRNFNDISLHIRTYHVNIFTSKEKKRFFSSMKNYPLQQKKNEKNKLRINFRENKKNWETFRNFPLKFRLKVTSRSSSLRKIALAREIHGNQSIFIHRNDKFMKIREN